MERPCKASVRRGYKQNYGCHFKWVAGEKRNRSSARYHNRYERWRVCHMRWACVTRGA